MENIKCLQIYKNGDTNLNERICLQVENSILLVNHYGKYNFPGGKIPLKTLTSDYLVGTSSLRELKEELGIVIKMEDIKKKSVDYQIDKHRCMVILLYAKVDRKDISFVKGSHIWESKDFTLVPKDKDYLKVFEIGMFLEENIQKHNQPCATHILVNKDKIEPKNIKEKLKNEYVNIVETKDKGKKRRSYLVKLFEDVDVTQINEKEKKLLTEANEIIKGVDVPKYVYLSDFVCKYTYIPYSEEIRKEVLIYSKFDSIKSVDDVNLDEVYNKYKATDNLTYKKLFNLIK